MEAKELRIGNYVDIINRSNQIHLPMGLELQVVAISLFSIDYIRASENLLEVEKPNTEALFSVTPIPLTEEWLLKTGFKKDGSKYLHGGGGRKSLIIWEGLYVFFFSDFSGHDSIKITHVHQLQNLYFALTGKELTIK